MIAVDTSVAVAAFASWHVGHRAALAAMADESDPRLPAHVALECFSVLTRLPPPHRARPELVTAFLRRRFPAQPLALPAARQRELIDEAVSVGIAGGAVYDALVGATARHADALLLSRDRRAARTYELLGVRYRLVA